MKKPCPVCGKQKAQRHCLHHEMADICSLCCVAERDERCAGCTYYTAAQQYRADRAVPVKVPQRHFIAEIDEEAEQAVDKALILAEKGKIAPAWQAMQDLLREHPRNHMVCYGLGTLHALKGEHHEAIQWFDRATAIFPYFVEAHFNTAVAYQKQLDVGNAIRAYRKVVQVGDPADDVVRKAQSFVNDMAKVIRENEGVDLDTYLESQAGVRPGFCADGEGRLAERAGRIRAAPPRLTGMRRPTATWSPSRQVRRKAEALAELDRALEINPDYGRPSSIVPSSSRWRKARCWPSRNPVGRLRQGTLRAAPFST